MKTVFHPTLDASRTVEDVEVDAWLEQGWLAAKPVDPEDPEAPKVGSKAALEQQAAELGLSTDGTKAELEQRIAEATAQ